MNKMILFLLLLNLYSCEVFHCSNYFKLTWLNKELLANMEELDCVENVGGSSFYSVFKINNKETEQKLIERLKLKKMNWLARHSMHYFDKSFEYEKKYDYLSGGKDGYLFTLYNEHLYVQAN